MNRKHSLADARVPVVSPADIVTARQLGRAMAARIGFEMTDLTVIATAISELARNILEYAQSGEIGIGVAQRGSRLGIVVIARDAGPGIPDVSKALLDGFSTGKGLGLGLPGVKRLMDELEILSEPGRGTTITARKWVL